LKARTRLACNQQLGTADFKRWVLECIGNPRNSTILDLGCGEGQFALVLAKTNKVVAVDLARANIEYVREQAGKQNVRLHAVQADFDHYNPSIKFDCVLGCYTLYYSKDHQHLFARIRQWLKQDGLLFFCGPDDGNNEELGQLLRDSGAGHRFKSMDEAKSFMDDAPKQLRDLGFSTQLVSFSNPIVFKNPSQIMQYWKSTALYDKRIEGNVSRVIEAHFQSFPTFTLTKRVKGIQARIRR